MKINTIFLILFTISCGANVSAQKYKSTKSDEVSKIFGESNFTSNKTFYENIEKAPNFTVLAKVLKNESLRNKLENQEMVTIFAISDEAFLNLSKKNRDSILDNTLVINSVVKYLAVPGRVDSYALKNEIAKKGGTIYLKTLDGQSLGVREVNGQLQLVDSEKGTATVIASDFYHKNGFFHIIDKVIFPPKED